MSTISNIYNIYGKQFNIVVANTDAATVLNTTGLPANVIILACPTKDGINDSGEYTMIATDGNGVPVRLTYNIKLGNGLINHPESNDIVHIHIDNDTVQQSDARGLLFNLESIIDNDTIQEINDFLTVNTDMLELASENSVGTITCDGASLKVSNDGMLYVDTDSLQSAEQDMPGTIISDNKTVYINENGKMSVITENLEYANKGIYGVSVPDNSTIVSNDGVYSINTDALQKASKKSFGISMPDNKTIIVIDGKYTVNVNNLEHATDTSYGTIMIDKGSLINENGIAVKDYDTITQNINTINSSIVSSEENIRNIIDELLKNDIDITLF